MCSSRLIPRLRTFFLLLLLLQDWSKHTQRGMQKPGKHNLSTAITHKQKTHRPTLLSPSPWLSSSLPWGVNTFCYLVDIYHHGINRFSRLPLHLPSVLQTLLCGHEWFARCSSVSSITEPTDLWHHRCREHNDVHKRRPVDKLFSNHKLQLACWLFSTSNRGLQRSKRGRYWVGAKTFKPQVSSASLPSLLLSSAAYLSPVPAFISLKKNQAKLISREKRIILINTDECSESRCPHTSAC